MHLNWLGQTCVKLQTKNQEEDVVILIDPYKPDKGDFPRSFSPQIALFSRGQDKTVTLSLNPFIVDALGELEVKGAVIYALPGSEEGNVMFKIIAEGLSVVHLGRANKKAENGLMDKLSGADILFLPVGGGDCYDPETAVALAAALEPKIIIPIAYRCDTDPGAKPVEEFLKEMGLKPEITDKKIILKKKDIPTEGPRVMVLEKNY